MTAVAFMSEFTYSLVNRVLSDVFHLDKYEDDSREAIIMDLYYYTLRFAWDNNFSREKVSAFFSILKRVHEMAIGKLSHFWLFFCRLFFFIFYYFTIKQKIMFIGRCKV